jgi:succinoglycan biosynthesis transport protein ExoP
MALSKIGESPLEIAFGVARRRKWAGLIAFAAMLSLAAPFSVFLPDIYRGTATVIVESQEAPSTLIRASVPELETRLVTIQQEILSRTRLINLIATLNLYPQWRQKMAQDAIVDKLRRDIHIEFTGTDQSRGRPATIGVKLTYVGLDPTSAAAVPNTLASQYVEENTRMREHQTGQMAQFLKTQVDAAAQELQRREQSLDAFKKSHSGELPDQVSINLLTLEQLNNQLHNNGENQAKARERMDRLSQGPQAVNPPDELATLKNNLRDLQSKYTDKHPEVIQLKARISELELQRARDGSGDSNRKITKTDRSAETELAALQREELALRSQIAAYDARIHLAPQHEQELEKLGSEYKTAKEAYDSLRTRYGEAQLADSLEQTRKGESFRILDAAVVPTLPAAPNRIRLGLLAVMLAVGSAIGVMLLLEHLDTSFYSVGELRQFTSVPVLATIPYINSRTNLMSEALRVAAFAGAAMCLCALFAFVAYHAARGNTQLVWMLAGPQV